jgi:hypothetical protein
MGSIGRDIFGGSTDKSQSTQSNQAYPYLSGAFAPTISNGVGAGTQIANMLGLNGPNAQASGFDTWKNSTGYKFGLDQGINAITGNAATQGLLNSGGTLKALDTYGQNYAATQYQNYLNPLQNLLGSALQGGSVLSSAGTVAQSTRNATSNNGGVGGFIGSLLNK